MSYFVRIFLIVVLIASAIIPLYAPTALAANIVVSNLQTDVQGNDVIVSWTTNERSNGCVQFGLNTNYDYQICSVSEPTYEHRLLMRNLYPEAVYNYRVSSRTPFGDESVSFNNTVKTGPKPDTTAPVIGDIVLEYVGATAVLIRWETNEETSAEVEYGVGYAFDKKYRSNKVSISHEALIKNLSPSTLYSYRISVKDPSGNKTISSQQQFRTNYNNSIDTNPLEITDVRPVSTNDLFIGKTRATISWKSSRPTSATVYYGTDPNRLRTRVSVDKDRVYHEVPIEGLTPGTKYYFKIRSRGIFRQRVESPGNEGYFSFTTKGRSVTVENAQSSSYDGVQPSRLTNLRKRTTTAPKVLGAFTYRFTPATSLLQPLHQSAIYAIVNNQRHKIANSDIMSSYGYQWKDVMRVPQPEVDKYKIAHLMKTPDNVTVYYVYVDKGIKIAIPSESVFNSYPANRWEDIITVSQEDIDIYSNATLVKSIDNDQIFLLENGKRRLILTPEAFNKNNFNYEKVVTINNNHLMSYPFGEAVK